MPQAVTVEDLFAGLPLQGASRDLRSGKRSLRPTIATSTHLVKNMFFFFFSPVGFKGNQVHDWTYFLIFSRGLKQMEDHAMPQQPCQAAFRFASSGSQPSILVMPRILHPNFLAGHAMTPYVPDKLRDQNDSAEHEMLKLWF